MDEGYIKFNCSWIRSKPIDSKKLGRINQWRDKLYRLGLIGAYEDGIGYGNMSLRDGKNFIITGSATGNLSVLDASHYTRVTGFSIEKNSLTCKGPAIASSESLTHAALYTASPEINAVIHVHSDRFWKKLSGKVPTSSKEILYGSPEMANEIIRLYRESDLKDKKILVMAGHSGGIITFGKSLEEAGAVLFAHIR